MAGASARETSCNCTWTTASGGSAIRSMYMTFPVMAVLSGAGVTLVFLLLHAERKIIAQAATMREVLVFIFRSPLYDDLVSIRFQHLLASRPSVRCRGTSRAPDIRSNPEALRFQVA